MGAGERGGGGGRRRALRNAWGCTVQAYSITKRYNGMGGVKYSRKKALRNT